jgi:hypothetical protein
LENRPLAQGRLDPDPATVHLYNLLRDGEPEAGATLGFGVGVVNLAELLKIRA